jgi:hypothetical protein
MTSRSASINFAVFFDHGQIIVCDPDLPTPYNDWTQQHREQGFSWRPGSVAFGMIEGGGEAWLTVEQGEAPEIQTDAERALVVPFDVGLSGLVGIDTTISPGPLVRIAPGRYALRFETGHRPGSQEPGEERVWCRLTFTPQVDVEPRLLRVDPSLNPSFPLLMDATPVGR